MVTDENYSVVFINGWVLIDAIIVTLILMEMLLVFIYQIYCKSWNVSHVGDWNISRMLYFFEALCTRMNLPVISSNEGLVYQISKCCALNEIDKNSDKRNVSFPPDSAYWHTDVRASYEFSIFRIVFQIYLLVHIYIGKAKFFKGKRRPLSCYKVHKHWIIN